MLAPGFMTSVHMFGKKVCQFIYAIELYEFNDGINLHERVLKRIKIALGERNLSSLSYKCKWIP